MRLVAVFLVLLTALAAPAQRRSWSIDDKPVGKPIGRLSPQEQSRLIPVLNREIQNIVKSDGLEDESLLRMEANLHAVRIRARGKSLYLVQSWGLPLCGGTGNCYVWLLDDSGRLLMASRGNGIEFSRQGHGSMPDIKVSSHVANGGPAVGIERWSFERTRYERSWCGLRSWPQASKHPVTQGGPCD
jgi:hypothetical protein